MDASLKSKNFDLFVRSGDKIYKQIDKDRRSLYRVKTWRYSAKTGCWGLWGITSIAECNFAERCPGIQKIFIFNYRYRWILIQSANDKNCIVTGGSVCRRLRFISQHLFWGIFCDCIFMVAPICYYFHIMLHRIEARLFYTTFSFSEKLRLQGHFLPVSFQK